MSQLPSDHLAELERRPFAFSCSQDIFPLDELHALSEFGNWMAALAAGAIKPLTADHEHFLQVDREEAEPETLHERAWVRLKGRREYEREQEAAVRSEPGDDYGIIEWDKEKCWW